jgi:hypothetical protein
LLERQDEIQKTLKTRNRRVRVLPWLFADGLPEKIRQLSAQFIGETP